MVTGQPGLFDLDRRYEGLDARNDALTAIAAWVPFERFRPKLGTALVAGGLRTGVAQRKSPPGATRDEVVMFKSLPRA